MISQVLQPLSYPFAVSQERPKRPRSVAGRQMRPSEGADGLPAPTPLSTTLTAQPGALTQDWGLLQPSGPSGVTDTAATVTHVCHLNPP
jgi:hypothetical protein